MEVKNASEWLSEFHLYHCDASKSELLIAKRGGNTYKFDANGECSCQGKMWLRLKGRQADCRHEAMARVFLSLQCAEHGICVYLPAQWELREYNKDGYAALLVCRLCEATKGYGLGVSRPLFPASRALISACLKNIADHAAPPTSPQSRARRLGSARRLRPRARSLV